MGFQCVMDRKEYDQRICKRFRGTASGTKRIIGILEKAETKKENIKIGIREIAKNHQFSFLCMSKNMNNKVKQFKILFCFYNCLICILKKSFRVVFSNKNCFKLKLP